MKPLNRLAVLGALTLGYVCSAHAIPIRYTANLNGANEEPPVATPATGGALVAIDVEAHTLRVMFDFADLVGTTTAAHIHGPTATPGAGTAGVITALPFFPGFPVGVSSGSFDAVFDTTLESTFNPSFVTAAGSVAAAEIALAESLAAGTAYLNIHTTFSPPGEIRGFLVPVAVTEPVEVWLLVAGGLGWVVAGRRRAGPTGRGARRYRCPPSPGF